MHPYSIKQFIYEVRNCFLIPTSIKVYGYTVSMSSSVLPKNSKTNSKKTIDRWESLMHT